MAPTLRVEYKRVGESRIHTDIYVPEPAPSKRTEYPVLINIHGGAFMLGSSGMVNPDQIQDCLERGWMVLAIDHRLCPQVSIQEGPLQDARSLLDWIHNGSLDRVLSENEETRFYAAATDRVAAFGTSSGGCLALGLGFDVPTPVAAILDFYGAKYFDAPFWNKPLEHLKAPDVEAAFMNQIWDETPVPTQGGVSLEGHAGPPDPTRNPRVAFAFTHMANGKVPNLCMPTGHGDVDAVLNVGDKFPPTCIVHGVLDDMVPIIVSEKLAEVLQKHGVPHELIKVEGEKHTFAGAMQKGSRTWETQRKGFDFVEKVIGRGHGF